MPFAEKSFGAARRALVAAAATLAAVTAVVASPGTAQASSAWACTYHYIGHDLYANVCAEGHTEGASGAIYIYNYSPTNARYVKKLRVEFQNGLYGVWECSLMQWVEKGGSRYCHAVSTYINLPPNTAQPQTLTGKVEYYTGSSYTTVAKTTFYQVDGY
ncbi:hypothetical protein Mame01_06260 [Microbispora amethystogenes]|nr:hypothetical protein Mame01_06260 [Microbispora amethystogenes]